MNIRMSTKGKRPLRSLTPSDKIHAIQRIHDGESKASVARDIGVPESTLRGWCKNEDKLRFMSRQSAVDNMTSDSLSDKVDIGTGLMSGPPDKRRKIDSSSLPLNFSNKTKYEDLSYKHPLINGLDYGTNKALSDLTFNGMASDYAVFSSAVKNKVFGAEITRPADPSISAISPLSSLSHLSGLSGLTQSPLAISFSELTSNLNILAQLNPSLATMTGLNSLNSTTNNLRPGKSSKNMQQSQQLRSSQNENDRQGLSVKNWAKQKPHEATYGLNLSQTETKNKIKCPSPSLAPSLGGSFTPISAIPEDPLLYWLKSQQAMLGLNHLYTHPTPPFSDTSPPIRTSTPQQSGHSETSKPVVSTPLTPSSTPSGSLDDKNSAWFNWCKAFGASLNSLNPAASDHINPTLSSTTIDNSNTPSSNQNASFENILYSQLTKDSTSHCSSSIDSQINELMDKTDCSGKPEDLSAKDIVDKQSSKHSPLPTPAHSPIQSPPESPNNRALKSPANIEENKESDQPSNSLVDCKDVLDNLLYKINNNNAASIGGTATPNSMEGGNESDESYNSINNYNNNDLNASNNNNNNSNKTDEEERAKFLMDMDKGVAEAVRHGEKFLNWLENCSNPRVTTVQLMQLRLLLAAIKSGNDEKRNQSKEFNHNDNSNDKDYTTFMNSDVTTIEEAHRAKLRRRK